MRNWVSKYMVRWSSASRATRCGCAGLLLIGAMAAADLAHAGTVLFSFDVQSVNATTVDVFLKEVATGSAEVIAAEGGLDFAGVRIMAMSPPASPVRIAAVIGDAAFDVSQTTTNGSPSDVTFTLDTIANPPVFGTIGSTGGEIRLGRFTFSNSLNAQTTFFKAVMITPGDFTITDSGLGSIESRFGIADSAQFAILGSNVSISATPLPSAVWGGFLLLGTLGMFEVRRSTCRNIV